MVLSINLMNFKLRVETKLSHWKHLLLPLKGGFFGFAVLIILITQFNFQHEEVVSHFVHINKLPAKIPDHNESG